MSKPEPYFHHEYSTLRDIKMVRPTALGGEMVDAPPIKAFTHLNILENLGNDEFLVILEDDSLAVLRGTDFERPRFEE